MKNGGSILKFDFFNHLISLFIDYMYMIDKSLNSLRHSFKSTVTYILICLLLIIQIGFHQNINITL